MKVSLYIGQSLDGFIADQNGNIDWMNTDHSADDLLLNHYEKFFNEIDILIMGLTTYTQLVNELTDEWPYPNHLTYVITNEERQNIDNIIFTSDIEEPLINNKNIWLVGGANTAKQYIDKNYVDEYIITTVPIAIGFGIKLFNNSIVDNLELVKVEQLKNYVATTYKRKSSD